MGLQPAAGVRPPAATHRAPWGVPRPARRARRPLILFVSRPYPLLPRPDGPHPLMVNATPGGNPVIQRSGAGQRGAGRSRQSYGRSVTRHVSAVPYGARSPSAPPSATPQPRLGAAAPRVTAVRPGRRVRCVSRRARIRGPMALSRRFAPASATVAQPWACEPRLRRWSAPGWLRPWYGAQPRARSGRRYGLSRSAGLVTFAIGVPPTASRYPPLVAPTRSPAPYPTAQPARATAARSVTRPLRWRPSPGRRSGSSSWTYARQPRPCRRRPRAASRASSFLSSSASRGRARTALGLGRPSFAARLVAGDRDGVGIAARRQIGSRPPSRHPFTRPRPGTSGLACGAAASGSPSSASWPPCSSVRRDAERVHWSGQEACTGRMSF